MRLLLLSAAIASCLATAAREGRAESELRELYRGARAQALGGAFVAIADDEQTLFMNPAGLAGVEKPQIHYLVTDIEASTDVITSASSLSAISDASTDSINELMGKNIYARTQITPSFIMPNFGVGILVDGQAALLAKNQAYPNIVVGYQTTNGVQFGYGVSLSGRRGRRDATKGDFRVGIGGKVLWRRGGYRTIGLTDLVNISSDTLTSMAGNFGRGIGFDAGAQYLLPLNNRLTLNLGAAMTEIGDVKFASEADTQPGNLSAGVAFRYTLPRSAFILAYDYRHILDDTDWRKRSHLGAEIQLPMLSLYAGLNQLNLTYGVSFDAWIFKLTAVSYLEEIGPLANQDEERRYLLRLALSFGL